MNSENHGTSEEMELYSLGRLNQADADKLAEHLLICGPCQEKFDEVEAYSLAMHRALLEQPIPAAQPARNWFSWNLLGGNAFGLRSNSFALAGGLALALLVGVMVFESHTRTMLPVASIQLSAMRGETVSRPAAREMNITLTDAPKTGGPFKVEMVNATGHSVWNGVGAATSSGVQVKVQSSSMDPGSYFIRLYSSNGSILHEYGIQVTP